RAFMEAVELPPAIVCGNSLGGHIAVELALSSPGWVEGLILTGSSGLFERTFTSRVPHQPTRAYIRERMEEIFYDPSLVTSEWVESIRRIVTTRSTARRVLQVARATRSHNVEERLRQIRVPTLLVWRKDARITPSDVAERFHGRIRGSQLVYLPNCGHAPMLERPEAFNAVVGDWLVETRARRALLGAGSGSSGAAARRSASKQRIGAARSRASAEMPRPDRKRRGPAWCTPPVPPRSGARAR